MIRHRTTNLPATGDGSPGTDRLLIAVDVDGTLLNTEFEDSLRQREVEAIAAVRRVGHVVALCTGRNSRSVNGLLARSGDGLDELPLILLNGAVVVGGSPRRRLCHAVMQRDTVRRIVEIFRGHDTMAMVYDTEDRGGILYHEDREANSVLSRYLSRRKRTVGAIVCVADLVNNLPESALEVGTIDLQKKIVALTAQIRREMANEVNVINTETLLSRDRYNWAEVYHHDCSKGRGAILLAREFGIPQENIIALGDNYNDLDLFAVAAFSVAMGNAPADVQAMADSIAPPVSDFGAAVVLEQIAAGKLPDPKQ